MNTQEDYDDDEDYDYEPDPDASIAESLQAEVTTRTNEVITINNRLNAMEGAGSDAAHQTVGGEAKGAGAGGAGGGNYVWARRDGGAGASGKLILYY